MQPRYHFDLPKLSPNNCADRFNMITEYYKNSSGDEIANVNFFYNIAHVEASDYAH